VGGALRATLWGTVGAAGGKVPPSPRAPFAACRAGAFADFFTRGREPQFAAFLDQPSHLHGVSDCRTKVVFPGHNPFANR
jgi:hypothetical protein